MLSQDKNAVGIEKKEIEISYKSKMAQSHSPNFSEQLPPSNVILSFQSVSEISTILEVLSKPGGAWFA